jgi:hypothetical protein
MANAKTDDSKPGDERGALVAEKGTGTRWWAIAVSIFSLGTLILGALGYGVALSVDTVLGIPHTQVFSSSMELLELSVWAVSHVIVEFGSAFTRLNADGTLAKIPWLSLAFFFVFWSLLAGYKWLQSPRSSTTNNTVTSTLRQLVNMPDPNRETYWFLLRRAGFYAVVSNTGWVFATIVALVGFQVLCFFVAFIPILGSAAGERHIMDYVIKPNRCAPLLDRKVRLSNTKRSNENQAQCVLVKKGDNVIEQGRTVFSTSGAIVLYNPQTGTVRRVPTNDAIVEWVGTLPGEETTLPQDTRQDRK